MVSKESKKALAFLMLSNLRRSTGAAMEGMTNGVGGEGQTVGGVIPTGAGFVKTVMGATGKGTGTGGALAKTGGSVCSLATEGGERDLLEAERESA